MFGSNNNRNYAVNNNNNNDGNRPAVNKPVPPDAVHQWADVVCNPGHERSNRELEQLPENERARVLTDLGGEPEVNEEDPDFVDDCLIDLTDELQLIKDKPAYLQALRQNFHYVNNPWFRIAFLRADQFDCKKAAQRIVRHFQHKLDLFGADKLTKDITLDDLSADDMESLEAGGQQFLPRLDRYGRWVVVNRSFQWIYKERANLIRAQWYLFMSMLQYENFQRKGYVAIGYSVGRPPGSTLDYETIRQSVQCNNAMPVRVGAVYHCYNNHNWSRVADITVHLLSAVVRLRFRVIFGTHQECNYKLMLMGVPQEDIPVTEDGELLTKRHVQWIEQQRRFEQQRQSLVANSSNNNNNNNASLVVANATTGNHQMESLSTTTTGMEGDDDDDDDDMEDE